MSHFYSCIQGGRGEATRAGSKDSGIRAWAQSHYARLSVQMSNHNNEDSAHFTLHDGHSSYSGGSLSLYFEDPTTLVRALGTDDEKLRKMKKDIEERVRKLNDEAPAALKRVERRRKAAAKAAGRDADAPVYSYRGDV